MPTTVPQGTLPSNSVSPCQRAQALEDRLRGMLRGVRLVCEAGIDEDTLNEIQLVIRAILPIHGSKTGDKYPALLVSYVVEEGSRNYHEGSFWPKLSVSGIPEFSQLWMGPAVLRALRLLNLPTFEEVAEHGLRYITPILLHAGIPRSCADDVLTHLSQLVDQGINDPHEAIAHLSRPSLRYALDKPAQRFLLYGGNETIDLIGRLITMIRDVDAGAVPDPETLGIPAYFVEVYQDIWQERDQRPETTRRGRCPRPALYFDPYDGLGPYLSLPSVDPEAWSHWEIRQAGESPQSQPTSADREVSIPLIPPGPWEVTLHPYSSAFAPCSVTFGDDEATPLLFFPERAYRLLPATKALPRDRVFAVAPHDVEFRTDGDGDPLPSVQDLPPLSGAWSAWSAWHLDLTGTHTIWAISKSTGQTIQWFKIRSPRPRLSGEKVAGVLAEGFPVYASWPDIELVNTTDEAKLSYRISLNDHSIRGRVRDLPGSGHQRVSLAIPGAAPVSKVALRISGPLGSDLDEPPFVVIEDLKISILPDRILDPDEEATLIVEARDGVRIAGHETRFVRPVTPGETSVAIPVQWQDVSIGLNISIPRLSWEFRDVENCSSNVSGFQRLTLEDLRARTLIVSTGRAARLCLDLRAGEEPLQTDEGSIAPDSPARWPFHLGKFYDTAKASGDSRLHFIVIINGEREHHVADVLLTYEARDLTVQSLVDGDMTLIQAKWQENQRFRDRVLRLWPLCRPWQAPVELPVPDGTPPVVEALIDGGKMPAGRYLAEVAISDDWTTPVRPDRSAPYTTIVEIGDVEAVNQRLALLDPRHPLEYLELVLLGHQSAVTPDAKQLAEYPDECMLALWQLVQEGDDHVDHLLHVLGQDAPWLAASLAQFLHTQQPGKFQILKFMLAVVPSLLTLPPASLSHESFTALLEMAPGLLIALGAWPWDDPSLDMWRCHLGWPIWPLAIPKTINWDLLDRPSSQIQAIKSNLFQLRPPVLTEEGFIFAFLSWLEHLNKAEGERWLRKYHALLSTARRDGYRADLLSALYPPQCHQDIFARKDGGTSRTFSRQIVLDLTWLPSVLVAAVLHLVDRTDDRRQAYRALREAISIARELTNWAMLAGSLIVRTEQESQRNGNA